MTLSETRKAAWYRAAMSYAPDIQEQAAHAIIITDRLRDVRQHIIHSSLDGSPPYQKRMLEASKSDLEFRLAECFQRIRETIRKVDEYEQPESDT